MQQCFFGFSSVEATFMSFLLTFVFKFFLFYIAVYPNDTVVVSGRQKGF